MNKKFRYDYSPKRAFTLVEIMVVVVIIGLLAAMAVPAMQRVRASTQKRAVINNLRQIYYAAQQYFMETGDSVVAYDQLVGEDKYIGKIQPVAGETYPEQVTSDEIHIQATGANIPGISVVTYDQ